MVKKNNILLHMFPEKKDVNIMMPFLHSHLQFIITKNLPSLSRTENKVDKKKNDSTSLGLKNNGEKDETYDIKGLTILKRDAKKENYSTLRVIFINLIKDHDIDDIKAILKQAGRLHPFIKELSVEDLESCTYKQDVVDYLQFFHNKSKGFNKKVLQYLLKHFDLRFFINAVSLKTIDVLDNHLRQLENQSI